MLSNHSAIFTHRLSPHGYRRHATAVGRRSRMLICTCPPTASMVRCSMFQGPARDAFYSSSEPPTTGDCTTNTRKPNGAPRKFTPEQQQWLQDKYSSDLKANPLLSEGEEAVHHVTKLAKDKYGVEADAPRCWGKLFVRCGAPPKTANNCCWMFLAGRCVFPRRALFFLLSSPRNYPCGDSRMNMRAETARRQRARSRAPRNAQKSRAEHHADLS